MVYTSGTTGKPKGAMLSHQYILNSVRIFETVDADFHDDVTLSYLAGMPCCRENFGNLQPTLQRNLRYFVDDLSKLYAYMLEVKPTVFAVCRDFLKRFMPRSSPNMAEMRRAKFKRRFRRKVQIGDVRRSTFAE